MGKGLTENWKTLRPVGPKTCGGNGNQRERSGNSKEREQTNGHRKDSEMKVRQTARAAKIHGKRLGAIRRKSPKRKYIGEGGRA